MKNCLNISLLCLLSLGFLISCNDLAKETEDKLNHLINKTESLDSLVNEEMDKVLALDTLILKENDKVQKLDSLINKSSSKIDSLSKKGSQILERFKN